MSTRESQTAVNLSMAMTCPNIYLYYTGIDHKSDILHTPEEFMDITRGALYDRAIKKFRSDHKNNKHPIDYTLQDWIVFTGAIVLKHVSGHELYKKTFDKHHTIYYTGVGCARDFFHTRKDFCKLAKCSPEALPFVVKRIGAMVMQVI